MEFIPTSWGAHQSLDTRTTIFDVQYTVYKIQVGPKLTLLYKDEKTFGRQYWKLTSTRDENSNTWNQYYDTGPRPDEMRNGLICEIKISGCHTWKSKDHGKQD